MQALKRHFQTFLTLLTISILGSCVSGIKGSGHVIKQDRDISGFTSIDANGVFDIYVRQGETTELVVVADDNLLESIETYVEDHTLYLRFDSYLKDYTELKAYITVNEIESIDISGACDLESKNKLRADVLKIEASGASDIVLDVECSQLEIKASGACDIKLIGSADELVVESSGASDINARKFRTAVAYIESSGSSSTDLVVTEKLYAEVDGASSVNYKGNPEVESETSGAGSVNKVN